LPLFEWTIVRLVVSENDGRRHNSQMEPQGRTIDSPFRTRRQSKTLRLEKATLRARDYVQTVGLNAETKKDRHRAEGEIFVLTFPFIGLTGLAGGFDRSMQHHLMNVSFKDGVYDPRKMVETFA
jgi:hypothetical protein